MRKTVRMTEGDLTRLVRRVIREQRSLQKEYFYNDDDSEGFEPSGSPVSSRPSLRKAEKGPFASQSGKNDWYDKYDRNVEDPKDFSEEREFGPNEYEDFMEYINDCDTAWCLKTKKYYDDYTGVSKIKVRK
jgi:hypothetical protein